MRGFLSAIALTAVVCSCSSEPGEPGASSTSSSSSSSGNGAGGHGGDGGTSDGGGWFGGDGGSGGEGGFGPIAHAPTSIRIYHGEDTPTHLLCANQALFWVNKNSGDVVRSDLDGSQFVTLASGAAQRALGMAAFGATMTPGSGMLHVAVREPDEVRSLSQVSASGVGLVTTAPGIVAYYSHDSLNGVPYWANVDSVLASDAVLSRTTTLTTAIFADRSGTFWIGTDGVLFFRKIFNGTPENVGTVSGDVYPGGIVATRDDAYVASTTGLHRLSLRGGTSSTVAGNIPAVANRGDSIAYVRRRSDHDTIIGADYAMENGRTIDETEPVASIAACGASLYWSTTDGAIWMSDVR